MQGPIVRATQRGWRPIVTGCVKVASFGNGLSVGKCRDHKPMRSMSKPGKMHQKTDPG